MLIVSVYADDVREPVEAVSEVQGGGPAKKKRRVTKLSDKLPKSASAPIPVSADIEIFEAPTADATVTEAAQLPSPPRSPVHAAANVEVNRGKQVAEAVAGEAAIEEEDEEMDATEIDLREWAKSAFPVQVEDLCAGIDSTIAKFAKEQASSSLSAVPCTALVPSVQTDPAAATGSSQQPSCFDEMKFASIQKCKESAYLGVDPNDLAAAHAELKKFGIEGLYQVRSRVSPV